MHEWIGVVVGVALIGFLFIFGQTLITLFKTGTLSTGAASGTIAADPITEIASTTKPALMNDSISENSLGIQDVVVGTGAVAQPGKKVTVHYTGTFTNGQVFDSSVTRGAPFSFLLGAGQVIQGWDEGVAGMRVGGKRILTVPSSLGYGPQDYGPIPGGSTLVFQVELLDVE